MQYNQINTKVVLNRAEDGTTQFNMKFAEDLIVTHSGWYFPTRSFTNSLNTPIWMRNGHEGLQHGFGFIELAQNEARLIGNLIILHAIFLRSLLQLSLIHI